MKKIVYLSLFITLSAGVITSCRKTKNSEEALRAESEKYENYNSQVESDVSKLSQDRKQQREKWLSELKTNPVYKALVDSLLVSQEYLPALTAINDAIKNVYINDNGEDVFSIEEPLVKSVESSADGKTKTGFVIPVSCLALKMNGGLPKEIVDVFERYRGKYRFYGTKGDIVIDNAGNQERITTNYNLCYAFALFNPKDEKVLDGIYESVKIGITHWNNEDKEYENAFIATRKAYMQHLRKVYPDSPYLIKADFEITPEKLYSDYEVNEVAADEKYKGRTIALAGRIHNIGKDVLNKPYISFETDYLKLVTCYFSDSDVKQIASLNKGETIIITGNCRGLTLTNVVIIDCKIIE
jgi:signal peptidase I